MVENNSIQNPLRIYKVIIPKKIYSKIFRIVKKRFPIEACGVLLGFINGHTARIEYIEELHNILRSTRAFWFDEKDWIKKILEGKRKGYQYLGLFHSHPREEALPSLSDRHRMLECPGEIWLIIAYKPGIDPSFTAWRVDNWESSITRLRVLVK